MMGFIISAVTIIAVVIASITLYRLLNRNITELKTELKDDIKELKDELKDDIKENRDDLKSAIKDNRDAIAENGRAISEIRGYIMGTEHSHFIETRDKNHTHKPTARSKETALKTH